jgi:WD40 repeat protein
MNTTLVASVASREEPYVGPNSFSRQDAPFFYGREQETCELASLLIAERIVLLNGPSGAGKTSLIRAGLLPKVDHQFLILPEIRVSCQNRRDRDRATNPYVHAVLQSLMSDEEEYAWLKDFLHEVRNELSTERALPELFKRLQECRFATNKPVLLIFDQFEEVLTLNPADLAAKQKFFQQLGIALDQRTYKGNGHDGDGFAPWALFSMRDEYVAALDPFLPVIPGRLRARFHMTALTRAQAKQAICRPASKAGVTIHDDLADAITLQLSRIQILHRGARTVQNVDGLYVEPVYLQIVCQWLWNKLQVLRQTNPAKNDLTLADIQLSEASTAGQEDLYNEGLAGEAYVNKCLERFYSDAVAEIASRKNVDERALRLWIDKHLITSRNLRSQVWLGGTSTLGLNDDVIEDLQAARIVRFDQRNGATWAELTHDRLVHPIRSSNERWYQKHLSSFQFAAVNWDKAGRCKDLLLSGASLADAEERARKHPGQLLRIEREFLLASQTENRAEADRHKHRRRVRATLGILAVALILLAFEAVYSNLQQRRITSQNTSIALLEADSRPRDALDRLLNPEQMHLAGGDFYSPEGQRQQALAHVLASWAGRPLLNPDGLQTRSLVRIRCTGELIVAVSREGRVVAWPRHFTESADASGASQVARGHNVLRAPRELINTKQDTQLLSITQFGSDQLLLATAGQHEKVSIVLFGLETSQLKVYKRFDAQFDSPVAVISAFQRHNDSWLAVGCADGSLGLWHINDRGDAEGPFTIQVHNGPLNVIAYRSGLLATGGGDDDIWLFMFDRLVDQLRSGNAPAAELAGPDIDNYFNDTGFRLREHTSGITDLVFSNDGDVSAEADPNRPGNGGRSLPSFLASSSRDGTVRLWSVDGVLGTSTKQWDATVGFRKLVYRAAPNAVPQILESGNSVVLTADNKSSQTPESKASRSASTTPAESAAIVDLALDPNDNYLVAGSIDGNINVWDFKRLVQRANTLKRLPDLIVDSSIRQTYPDSSDKILDISMGDDSQWVAIADLGNCVHLWRFERVGAELVRREEYKIVLASPLQAIDLCGADQALSLVSGTADGVIRLWNVNGKQLRWERDNLSINEPFELRRSRLAEKSIDELEKFAQHLIENN